MERPYSPNVHAALAAMNHNAINYDLCVQVIQLAMTMTPATRADWVNAGGGGAMDAILVFLPGVKEIETLRKALLDVPNGPFELEPQRSWIMPLHGTLPHEEQAEVFKRPPPGAFYTLVPIRPRRRGERRSLRTFAVLSLRPPLAFNPRPRRL